MAARIPISADTAQIPRDLRETLIGPITATEIGWLAHD
jgi:hypothetical protein